MSRVADAFRKSRQTGDGRDPIGPRTPDDWSLGPWSGTEVPWDVNEPPAPPKQVVPHPATSLEPARGVSARPTVRPADNWSEQLTLVVQRIFHQGGQTSSVRSVLFVPLGDRVDSATLCATAGDVLAAQTAQSVCLVDADVRTPALHTAFGLPAARGLSDAFASTDPAATCVEFMTRIAANLWLLSAGTLGRDAHLPVEPLRALVSDLLGTFDYVLIAGSSGASSPDAVRFGSAVDGVVLVLHANATRREAARRLTDDLHAAHVRVLGAVLANRTLPIPEVIYRNL
jgi:Mrp family chromosome partitioning ATPase